MAFFQNSKMLSKTNSSVFGVKATAIVNIPPRVSKSYSPLKTCYGSLLGYLIRIDEIKKCAEESRSVHCANGCIITLFATQIEV